MASCGIEDFTVGYYTDAAKADKRAKELLAKFKGTEGFEHVHVQVFETDTRTYYQVDLAWDAERALIDDLDLILGYLASK